MMKTKLFFLTVAIFATSIGMAQTNLVPNGDFEDWDWTSGQPKEWRRNGCWIEKKSDAQSGNYSCYVEADSWVDYQAYITSSNFTLEGEKTYTVSFYYKILEGDLTEFFFTLWCNIPNSMWADDVHKVSITDFELNKWIKVEFDYSCETTNTHHLTILHRIANGESKVEYDNVQVVEKQGNSIKNIENIPAIRITQTCIFIEDNMQNVDIYDITGNLLRQTSKVGNIDISNFPPGVYFVKMQKNNNLYTLKFIKK